jgi:hypothetical protein
VSTRIGNQPSGGTVAQLGFYSSPVQKVVKRWLPFFRVETVEDFFRPIALTILHNRACNMAIKNSLELALVNELITAFTKVCNKRDKPDYWLLKLPLSVQTNWKFDGWKDVSRQIERSGGPDFLPATLAQQAKSLRLTP